MGGKVSTLSAEDISELQQVSPCMTGFLRILKRGGLIDSLVDADQLKRLYKRFKSIDRDDSGTISHDEFVAIPELAINPLCDRIVSVLDSEKTDEVNFKQFIQSLAVFSRKADRDEKIKCKH